MKRIFNPTQFKGNDLINQWGFIKVENKWHVYRNGDLYFTFGLDLEDMLGDLFKNEKDKHDPQQVLDLVLELIFIMEEETCEYWTDDDIKYALIDCMFKAVAKEFGGVR